MITAVSSPGAAFQGLPFRNAIAPEILTILLEKDKEDKRGSYGRLLALHQDDHRAGRTV